MDSTQTKPDALDMLRTLNNKYFPMRTERGTMVSLNLIVAALELERRENDAVKTELANAEAQIRSAAAEVAERDAKIRYHLERVLDQFDAAEAGKAAHAPDEYDFADAIRDALKALNGGSE